MSDEGSDVEIPKEPTPPPQGKKFFLAHCNSYEGLSLFKEMWNKNEFIEGREDWHYAINSFVGTIKKDEKTTSLMTNGF
jgi:hypothetical protein